MTQENESQTPKLEMRLDAMENIEDKVEQWMLLEEHWTKNNLSRYQQLDHAKTLFTAIIAEIKAAYKTCPAYSGDAE